jgi:hypothetical protein
MPVRAQRWGVCFHGRGWTDHAARTLLSSSVAMSVSRVVGTTEGLVRHFNRPVKGKGRFWAETGAEAGPAPRSGDCRGGTAGTAAGLPSRSASRSPEASRSSCRMVAPFSADELWYSSRCAYRRQAVPGLFSLLDYQRPLTQRASNRDALRHRPEPQTRPLCR